MESLRSAQDVLETGARQDQSESEDVKDSLAASVAQNQTKRVVQDWGLGEAALEANLLFWAFCPNSSR